jgi:hypoxanthine phosphoribosyltransferase
LITHFLGREEVAGYARDLAARLVSLGKDAPAIWCPIGYSGIRLAEILGDLLPTEAVDNIRLIDTSYNKKTGRVAKFKKQDVPLVRRAKSVLVLDSSIHSGSTMLAVIKELGAVGAKNVLTYSLVLKQNSKFIPHYFGVLVGDHDRTLFLLDEIPNNRLFKDKIPVGVLRKLTPEDCQKDIGLKTGLPSMDKMSFPDLLYQKMVHGHEVFVIELYGKVIAFLGLRFSGARLLIDLVASDKKFKGKGLGGALLRWAETLARSKKCAQIELWAVFNQVEWYERCGFKKTNEEHLDLGGEKYFGMTRDLLYSFDLRHLAHG